MFNQKGGLIIAGFLAGLALFDKALPLPDKNMRNIQEYYWEQAAQMELDQASAWLDDELAQLETEIGRFPADQWQTPDTAMEMQTLQQQITALSELSTEADRLQMLSAQGYQVRMLETKPYEAMFTTDFPQNRSISAIIQLGVLILILSGVYAYDNESRMTPLLKSTCYGRSRLWWKKTRLMVGIVLVVWGYASGCELVKTILAYGKDVSFPEYKIHTPKNTVLLLCDLQEVIRNH